MSTEITDSTAALTKELKVPNELGLHARVAAKIAETVQGFDCRVMLEAEGREAEADSVLSILTLGAPHGCTIGVTASGNQAADALAALEELFQRSFGE